MTIERSSKYNSTLEKVKRINGDRSFHLWGPATTYLLTKAQRAHRALAALVRPHSSSFLQKQNTVNKNRRAKTIINQALTY